MWSPTHIQVTVQKAKGLLTKGKNGTNNCFVTIGLGKEKYQTSVKDKAEANCSWNEECELKIPDQGNRAELVLTCLHRNNLGLDEFLGQVTLPLNEMDVYDRPRSKWFKLESKPGQEKKNKDRGELEVRISFIVKSGSLTDLSKKEKHKSSIGQLASSVGGSLLSIGTIEKRKGIKKFAKSLGSKMHLHSKKKNKDGDDMSINGSFASIGTPNSSNGGSRRYGQRAGEADPGVISEDEDEFVFDNLSHKSSGSSLNIRSNLPPPTQNYVPHNPSPLLNGFNGKLGGKKLPKRDEEDIAIDPELEEIEQDLRARTLPPPSKPPRTAQPDSEPYSSATSAKDPKLDEWEKKLYGKHLEIGSSDSLKRRSWELSRVPLPTANEETTEELKAAEKQSEPKNGIVEGQSDLRAEHFDEDSSSSSSSSDDEELVEPLAPVKEEHKPVTVSTPQKHVELNLTPVSPKVSPPPPLNLLAPDSDGNDFDQFNASFAKFEQRNSAKIFDGDLDTKWNSTAFIDEESKNPVAPQVKPRLRERTPDLKKNAEEEERRRQAELAEEQRVLEEQRRRAEEDARLEEELRLNEQRLREEEEALQEELRQQEEQRRREAKRREEDQRILNFVKRSTSTEEEDDQRGVSTPEQSPRERVAEKREKRLGKFKYLNNKRDKHDDVSSSSPSPKSSERIIIGHEKSMSHAERRAEISAALAKKYEGKSREELMLIANGMENEALLQRQRVKELEDYLDNLLLRVMETHPKILQNPYSRTTSAKSG